MPPTIDSSGSQATKRVLCYYANLTEHLQILKSAHREIWAFERVVFPGQRLFFEAIPTAHLEIYEVQASGLSLMERNRCDRWKVQEQNSHAGLSV